MKLLLSSHSFYSFSLEETFSAAAELGFDGVELVQNQKRETRNSGTVKRLSSQYGIPVSVVHQPAWHWPHTTRGELGRLAKFAKSVGAEIIVVHLSVLRFHPKNKIFPFLAELEKKHGVLFALENNIPNFPDFAKAWAWQGRGIENFLANHKEAFLTLDFPRFLQFNGQDVEFIKKNKDRIRHVHLHGIKGGKAHKALGLGDKSTLAFFKSVYPLLDNRFVTLEVFPHRWFSGKHKKDFFKIKKAIAEDTKLVQKLLGKSSFER